MADGYLAIHAGRALLARGEGGGVEEFIQTWGDWARPRFFAGSVLYRTEVAPPHHTGIAWICLTLKRRSRPAARPR